jgi:hypothetical protein
MERKRYLCHSQYDDGPIHFTDCEVNVTERARRADCGETGSNDSSCPGYQLNSVETLIAVTPTLQLVVTR